MISKTFYTYDGHRNESAFIEVEPVKVGPLVAAVDNHEELQNIGTRDKPKFRISLCEQPDFTHVVILSFTFPAGTANDAEYRITVSDDSGNVWNDIPAVKNDDDEMNFEFNVVSG